MYTKTYIQIAYQNLDLHHIPDINLGFGILYKSRFWNTI
jgi:hypothetical protein